ncbi:MAG: universal stress protein [Elusimicrobia bacterium]|nr:universal stress protein [Elusimicrobiota bacterium]MDE2236737.1 universal stress protein [Elusimicrobiota bacterium]MDE2425167.1 universal stress protein [Elusimicrobiota bacterium]
MIFPPQTILVPSDLSPSSQDAGEHARELARRFGARLEVVYAAARAPWLARRRLSRAERLRMTVLLRERFGEAALLRIVESDPVDAILEAARTRRPDLVVMGTHSHSVFDHLLNSSVSEAVLRLSPRPVLVAHRPPRPVRAVLAPVNLTDYSETGLLYAAKVAAALGKPLRALLVCGAGDSVDRLSRRLAASLETLPAGVLQAAHASVEVRQGQPTDEIIEAGFEAGLVVLVAHRRSLLHDVVLGTTAERVLRHSEAPVIAVPGPQPEAAQARIAAGRESAFHFHF